MSRAALMIAPLTALAAGLLLLTAGCGNKETASTSTTTPGAATVTGAPGAPPSPQQALNDPHTSAAGKAYLQQHMNQMPQAGGNGQTPQAGGNGQ